MRVMVSPAEMSALAANASSSLELVSRTGSVDADVLEGLLEGEEFCDVLEKGSEVLRSQSNFFSDEGFAASEFSQLVFEMPEGRKLAAELTKTKNKLTSIIEASKSGLLSEDVRAIAGELAAYFYDFAIKLPFYEAIRERMTMDLRKRA
jgi:hypothetical protein